MVIVLVLKVSLRCWIHLEALDFLQAWTHILSQKFVCRKVLIEIAIPKDHASPSINVLLKRLVIFSLALMLYPERVEKKLRYSDKLALFVVGAQRRNILCRICKEVLWNSRHKTDSSFAVAFDFLDEAQVILVDATFDSDPLVLLEPLLLQNLTALHNLGHLVDWYHLHRSVVYSRESLKNLLDML